jgi:4-diphosphocytidyl-2-C-methyl-D-erythritol kinase
VSIAALAPAKINLGLEILGRREDGYHEVRTVLCAISLADRLTFTEADTDEIAISGAGPDVPTGDNLALRALRALRERGAAIPPQRLTIEKRIPAAAGLGGASSDAAATIRTFAALLRAAGGDAHTVAASLGSDVPFFLGGPIALASGRGDLLTPLPDPAPAWVVLVTPDLDIPDKTRTMYRAVEPAWWSDGRRVDAIARRLPAVPTEAPFNVFERALMARFPACGVARDQLLAAAAPFAALTGAGPTFYTIVERESHARAIAAAVTGGMTVHVARLGSSAHG